jgi:hypothetical protein
MKNTFDDKPALPVWLLLPAALSILTVVYLTFVWVSTEVTMGIIQRIFLLPCSRCYHGVLGGFRRWACEPAVSQDR